MVTMRDVAAEAGVSPMTVSNALTGRRPVSEATRQRVLETVDRLGYQINVAARSLRQGRTGIVGIAVPGLDSHYYGQLASRLVKAFRQAGWAAVVEQTGASREGEIAAFNDSRLNAYDGLVMSPVGLGEEEIKALSGDLPFVVLGERPMHHAVDRVGMANVEGSAAATGLLLSRGCRELAFVGVPSFEGLDTSAIQEGPAFLLRARGFLDAARSSPGVAVTPGYAGATMAGGAQVAGELLDGRDVDGIVCATDSLAFGVLRGLADRGVRVPDDLLVVGFDDVDDSRFHIPSLSTVDPGHDRMAAETVRLLLRRMEDRDAEPQDVTSEFRVVERESTTRVAAAS